MREARRLEQQAIDLVVRMRSGGQNRYQRGVLSNRRGRRGVFQAKEILKTVKSLGKKMDDQTFWNNFAGLCGQGNELAYERFEELMKEHLRNNRIEDQKRKKCDHGRGGFKAMKSNPISMGKFSDLRAAHSVSHSVRDKINGKLAWGRKLHGYRDDADAVESFREPRNDKKNSGKRSARVGPGIASPDSESISPRTRQNEVTFQTFRGARARPAPVPTRALPGSSAQARTQTPPPR